MQRQANLLWLLVLLGCHSNEPVTVPAAAQLQKLPPGNHQQTADIPGLGSLKYTIAIPETYDGNAPVPLVIALHYGYDGPQPEPYTGQGMIDAFGSGLSELNAIIIAPDAMGGDWTDARNEQAAVWLTQSAQQTYTIDSKKVLVTGFSMGGAGSWFIGSRHPDVFTAVIPVAAPIPSGVADCKIPVYVIHSDQDQVVSYRDAHQHAEAVKAKGTPLRFETAQGLSHYETDAYSPYVARAVIWLQQQWN